MKRALLVLFTLACGGRGDEHLDRAQHMIGSGQWANARTELGQVLAKDAHHTQARALLVYCLDREDGLRRAIDVDLPQLYLVARAIDRANWQRVPAEVRKLFDTMFGEARKKLFDKSIDTQDARDVSAVLIGAARYSYAHDDDPVRKATAASLLASDGDAAALGYLITQLKGEHPEAIVDDLVRIGPPAVEPLRAVLADKNFIGRRAALDALARIQAGIRGHDLVTAHPGLAMIKPSVPGARRLAASRTQIGGDPELIVIDAQYAAIPDGPDDGVVLLEAWDDRSGGVIAQLFVARNADLAPLAPIERDAPLALGGPSALYDLAVDHGRARVRRVVEVTSQREVDAKGGFTPAPNMRVRLANYATHGAIVRADDGLWVVKLDEPLQGLTELPVAASALVAQRNEPHTEVSVETLSGTIRVDRWDITQRDAVPEEPTK